MFLPAHKPGVAGAGGDRVGWGTLCFYWLDTTPMDDTRAQLNMAVALTPLYSQGHRAKKVQNLPKEDRLKSLSSQGEHQRQTQYRAGDSLLPPGSFHKGEWFHWDNILTPSRLPHSRQTPSLSFPNFYSSAPKADKDPCLSSSPCHQKPPGSTHAFFRSDFSFLGASCTSGCRAAWFLLRNSTCWVSCSMRWT